MKSKFPRQLNDSCHETARALRSISDLLYAIFGMLFIFALVLALCYGIYVLVHAIKQDEAGDAPGATAKNWFSSLGSDPETPTKEGQSQPMNPGHSPSSSTAVEPLRGRIDIRRIAHRQMRESNETNAKLVPGMDLDISNVSDHTVTSGFIQFMAMDTDGRLRQTMQIPIIRQWNPHDTLNVSVPFAEVRSVQDLKKFNIEVKAFGCETVTGQPISFRVQWR